MRLQVTVYRHTLPPVHLIFNTTSSSTTEEPVHTVADFLSALNLIVPLESSDGEWDLEEYVVGLPATADQNKVYECLHYQLVTEVFREDDEVVIRGLTTDEIRQRRRGGRSQITEDGRRLLDGVPWGRRFRPMTYRPDVTIPPRKRRRLMLSEDEYGTEDGEDELLQLDYPPAQSKHTVPFLENDEYLEEEEEDDDEYEDPDEDQGDGDSSDEIAAAEQNPNLPTWKRPSEVTALARFEDADSTLDGIETELLDEQRIRVVLGNTTGSAMPYQNRATESRSAELRQDRGNRGKRKRVTFQDQGVSGLSPRTTAQGAMGPYLVDRQSNGQTDNAGREDTSETSSEDDEDSDGSESSYSESGSESDSSGDDSNDSSVDETTSSSGTDSSSNESQSLVDASGSGTNEHANDSSSRRNGQSKTVSPKPAPRADNPPGSGSSRTRKNNERAKKKKRLSNLKAQGLLPAEADFEDLKAYDSARLSSAGMEPLSPSIPTDMGSNLETKLEAKRREILSGLEIGHSEPGYDADAGMVEMPSVHPPQSQTTNSLPACTQLAVSSDASGVPKIRESPEDPPSKRTRLDIQSTRRMLFNSLGLRNPKTKAAEDALREKLKSTVKQTDRARTTSIAMETVAPALITDHDDSWKNKLIISAVECVQEGRKLTAPPFPFKQRWEKEAPTVPGKEPLINSYPEIDCSVYDDVREPNVESTVQSILKTDGQKEVHSDKYSADFDSVVHSTDLTTSSDLRPEDVVEGAIISYKELYMNSRFEPQESEYRLAQVLSVDNSEILILLSKKDRRELSSSNRYDEHGQRLYHGFELPGEDDDTDDGTRSVFFESLLQPKLIRAGNVQVIVSSADSSPHIERSQQESICVPESAPGQLQGEFTSRAFQATEHGSSKQQELLNVPAEGDTSSAEYEKLLQPIQYEPSGGIPSFVTANGHSESQEALVLSKSDAERDDPQIVDTTSFPSSQKSGIIDSAHISQTNASKPSDLLNEGDVRLGNADYGHSQLSFEGLLDVENGAQSKTQGSYSSPENRPARSPVAQSDISNDANSMNGAEGSPQPRSSQRIARAKIQQTSPAARMMKSALAGLNGRKGMNTKRKSKV